MPPTPTLVLLWLGFAASHVVLSSRSLRPRLVARLGDRAFLGLYSLVALAFFVPLVSVYLEHRHEGAWLWIAPSAAWWAWPVQAATAVGVLLAVAGIVTPAPSSLGGGRTEVRGVHRITRHPVIMGLGWLGLFHLVYNASATDVAFFAGFPAFAVAGCWHQERRMLAARGPDFRAYVEATPFLPFTGRSALQGLRELSPAIWAAGLAAAITIRWLH